MATEGVETNHPKTHTLPEFSDVHRMLAQMLLTRGTTPDEELRRVYNAMLGKVGEQRVPPYAQVLKEVKAGLGIVGMRARPERLKVRGKDHIHYHLSHSMSDDLTKFASALPAKAGPFVKALVEAFAAQPSLSLPRKTVASIGSKNGLTGAKLSDVIAYLQSNLWLDELDNGSFHLRRRAQVELISLIQPIREAAIRQRRERAAAAASQAAPDAEETGAGEGDGAGDGAHDGGSDSNSPANKSRRPRSPTYGGSEDDADDVTSPPPAKTRRRRSLRGSA